MGENRLTRITTRTGDAGSTGLADGSRLAKTHPHVVAIGEVDELNAHIGLLCVTPGLDAVLLTRLREVQNDLFDLGGELSLPESVVFNRTALAGLDADMETWNAALPPLKEFVLPGSNEANARAHLARTVCRRAERSVWQLVEMPDNKVPHELPRYLNRLSDWLFVLGRRLARRNGGSELTWRRR